MLGSCHALELPFVFGAVHLPVVQIFSGGGPAVRRCREQMQEAWLAFAASGSPSHDGIGEWLPWDPAGRATMTFGAETALVRAPRDAELASWSATAPSSRVCPAERVRRHTVRLAVKNGAPGA